MPWGSSTNSRPATRQRHLGRLGIPPLPHRLRLTAETLGHAGLASVAGYTKISEARRRKALDAVEEAGL
jgi:hypothetical protein